ncbi:hypothetical protein [Enterococcus wangshanyuanii]|nr:hypothetical protein [Enterococcus wangshanyuanii]
MSGGFIANKVVPRIIVLVLQWRAPFLLRQPTKLSKARKRSSENEGIIK